MGVIAVLFAACGAEDTPILPEVSWSSEDYDFATNYKEDPLCAGTLKFQQGFVDLAQEIFGQPVGGERFTYYLLTTRRFEELLGTDRHGAYGHGRVYTKTIPHLHEVTHAVVDLSIGSSHPFFNEGIAEVFRERYPDNSRAKGSVDEGISIAGADGKLPEHLYGRAGHFMSYALEVHGVEATVALLAAARPGDPPESLKSSVALAFGMPYEDVLADYAQYPVCPHEEFRWPITECGMGPKIPAVKGGWLFDMKVDCSSEAVIGPRISEFWSVYTVEIPEDGDYLVSVFGGEDDLGHVRLDHCSPGCAPDKGLEIKIRTSRTVPLRQGLYQLTTAAYKVESGHLRARIDRVGPGSWSNP